MVDLGLGFFPMSRAVSVVSIRPSSFMLWWRYGSTISTVCDVGGAKLGIKISRDNVISPRCCHVDGTRDYERRTLTALFVVTGCGSRVPASETKHNTIWPPSRPTTREPWSRAKKYP